jgi:hypothetical protein
MLVRGQCSWCPRNRTRKSKQLYELFLRQAGLTDQGSQRSFGQLAVIRDAETPP